MFTRSRASLHTDADLSFSDLVFQNSVWKLQCYYIPVCYNKEVMRGIHDDVLHVLSPLREISF